MVSKEAEILTYALSEFEKYRVKQDQLYQSDFDRMLLEMGEESNEE